MSEPTLLTDRLLAEADGNQWGGSMGNLLREAAAENERLTNELFAANFELMQMRAKYRVRCRR